mgnify:CR=1 FL=1|jgi:hypothetical protein
MDADLFALYCLWTFKIQSIFDFVLLETASGFRSYRGSRQLFFDTRKSGTCGEIGQS